MNITSATWDTKKREWVFPQMHYHKHKYIAKSTLITLIDADPLIKEAINIEPRIKELIEEAKKQRCVISYNLTTIFYSYYKPHIQNLVGWESIHKRLRTQDHYDAIYQAINDLLPADEIDLYSEGIMPNGMYSPSLQKKYNSEYP